MDDAHPEVLDKYLAALGAAGDASLDPAAALAKLGLLIDLSHDLRRLDGVQAALAAGDKLLQQDLQPEHRALLHYFLANAYEDLRTINRSGWELYSWEQLEIEKQIVGVCRNWCRIGDGGSAELRAHGLEAELAIVHLLGVQSNQRGWRPAMPRGFTMTSHSKDATVLPLTQSGSGGAVGAPEDALRLMLQQLIHETLEREFQQFLGAARFERSPARRGVRNGHRRRRLLTRIGSLELRVPRDRAGQFQPALFARYQRSEQALVLALVEMYLQGISTRKVSAVVEQLCGTTVSASEVSALTKSLDATVAAWRQRALSGKAYPYLIVDAHVERVRREGQVRSTAALWVIGVGADGYREHLGVWLGASESGVSWRRVFEDLVKRGLTGVQYVVSDEHAGLVDAIRRYFPDAAHQRCQVHFLRNAREHVASADLQQRVKDGLRNVWSSATQTEAEARLARVVTELRPEHARLADWLEETAPDTLAVYALADREARRRLATTNAIEHDHAEVRRRTTVIRVFPNEASFVRLASALAMERNEQWLARRYVAAIAPTRPAEEAVDAA